MSFKFNTKIILVTLVVSGSMAATVYASHSWGNYHWARKTNPFTLKLGDNVSSVWDAYLREASNDWSQSSVLDTTVVSGSTNPKRCSPISGRIETCSSKYGFNGWLGVASIWISGDHITKGIVKMNDNYFNTAFYNTPQWRRLVMCQEIGHTFGLDHQDEDFSNPNLGTCMDYTSDPDGPPSNEHPNAHDYVQLEAIYSHFDSVTTVSNFIAGLKRNNGDTADLTDWGKSMRKDKRGKSSLYERDLGRGEKVFTFIVWAE